MRRLSSVITVVVALTLAASPGWAQAVARYVAKKDGKVIVSLRVSTSANVVTRMTISYRVTCDNGGSARRSTQLTNLHVNHSGHFSFRGSYTGSRDHSTNHVTMRGTVTSKRASGTFKLTAVGTDPSTGGEVRCHSATVRWQAKRVH